MILSGRAAHRERRPEFPERRTDYRIYCTSANLFVCSVIHTTHHTNANKTRKRRERVRSLHLCPTHRFVYLQQTSEKELLSTIQYTQCTQYTVHSRLELIYVTLNAGITGTLNEQFQLLRSISVRDEVMIVRSKQLRCQ